MKKKGFTLIELLAVIVVLAIIALIATPIVMNTIKKSQKGAAERSADNYIEAVETAVATSRLDSDGVPDGTYTINDEGNLEGNGLKEPLTIEMSGNKPSGGTITIKNGQVETSSTMTIGSYEVAYNPTNKKYEATEKDSSSSTNILCKANTTKATALVWTGYDDVGLESSYMSEEVGLLASEATSKYDVGVTYTCELGDGEENTFYILETSGDNVSLIMSKNLGNQVAWVTKEDYLAAGGTEDDWNKVCTDCGNNNLGPITANKILKERTSGWTKLNEDQITLPSGQQIATAGGDTKWNNDTYGDGFSSAKWLCSYTKFTTGTYGYWTINASSVHVAWSVDCNGYLYNDYSVNNSYTYGVRPVITLSKSQLN